MSQLFRSLDMLKRRQLSGGSVEDMLEDPHWGTALRDLKRSIGKRSSHIEQMGEKLDRIRLAVLASVSVVPPMTVDAPSPWGDDFGSSEEWDEDSSVPPPASLPSRAPRQRGLWAGPADAVKRARVEPPSEVSHQNEAIELQKRKEAALAKVRVAASGSQAATVKGKEGKEAGPDYSVLGPAPPSSDKEAFEMYRKKCWALYLQWQKMKGGKAGGGEKVGKVGKKEDEELDDDLLGL